MAKFSPPREVAVPAPKGSTTGSTDDNSDALLDPLLHRVCGGALGRSDRDGVISALVSFGDDGTSMVCFTSGTDLTMLLKQQDQRQ